MSNKIIVITGATGGVGSLLSLGLAKKGNHIICLGRKLNELKELVDKINGLKIANIKCSASYIEVDMMDSKAVAASGKKIIKDFKKIDVWINNVGVNNHNAIGPSWDLNVEDWCTEVSINLYSAFIGSHTAVNLMKNNDYGYVINLGGGGASEAKPFVSAYGAAKTSIVRFTETLNQELKEENLNIKAFSFNPGFIKNERTAKLVESKIAKKYLSKLIRVFKSGKISSLEDSISLIDTLISGRADNLGGRYFLSDNQNIENAIANSEDFIKNECNFLRLK